MRLEAGQPVTAEARIRPLRSSDFAPVNAVIDDWWGGRAMARMLPRLLADASGEAAAMAYRHHLLDDS